MWNWLTTRNLAIAVAAALTVFTETLLLRFLETGRGYMVAYSYLVWTLAAWAYLCHKWIASKASNLLLRDKPLKTATPPTPCEPIPGKAAGNGEQPNGLQGLEAPLPEQVQGGDPTH